MTEWFLVPVRLWCLLAVVALIAVYVFLQFRRPRYAVRFSNLELLDKVAPQRPGWRRHLGAGFFAIALATMVIAFAQPIMTIKVPQERTTIMLAIDTSLSMAAEDVAPNRLEAAQAAAVAFLDELPDDLNVGLVSFAGNAQLLVPPTQDHESIKVAIDGLELDKATAIGDAVKLSLEVIQDQAVGVTDGVPDAAIVLISDGETTVGLPTEEAIPLAQEAGVAVSTIAYGTADGQIMVDEDGDGVGQLTGVPVNVEELRGLAEDTGGTAYTAESASDLAKVYEELGSTIGFVEESTDVSYRFIGAGLLIMVIAAAFSLRWSSRLP
ncbi:MAG: VWA domain-containing protein [Microthrixaceae bacterium]